MPKAEKPSGSHHQSRTLPYAYFSPAAIKSSEHTEVNDARRDRSSTSSWPAEDDKKLLRARQAGHSWGYIAELFDGKTPNACRKRYERLMEKRNNADSWDMNKKAKLANLYEELRPKMWSLIAEQLGERWQVVETKCMETGLKTLQTTARSAIRRERSNTQSANDDTSPKPSLYLDTSSERSDERTDDNVSECCVDSALGHDMSISPFARTSQSMEEELPTPISAGDRTASTSRSYPPPIPFTLFPIRERLSQCHHSHPSPSQHRNSRPSRPAPPPSASSSMASLSTVHDRQQTEKLPGIRSLAGVTGLPSVLASHLTRQASGSFSTNSMGIPVTTH